MERNETGAAETWLVIDLPPTLRQTWSAVSVAAVAFVAFAVVAPFTGRPLLELNSLFPCLDAIVFVTDLVTAVLLFAQFSISRSRALLALASGYLFTALIVVPHALTFSGAFAPTGLLSANIQTGSWLFIFWHIGFGAALFAYAAFRGEQRATFTLQNSALPAISWTVVTMAGLTCSLTWLATAGATLLPPIILDNSRISPFVVYPILFTILIFAAALAALSVRRARSELDQWLMVVALVSIGELAFSGFFPSVRFSVGFYAGRMFSLITSSIVLIVLLAETTRLYLSLARTNVMLQRERSNKLMNLEAMAASIAHEVRQPLTGIATSGNATLRFLEQTPPNIEKATSAVCRMVDASRQTSTIFDNVLALFGKAQLAKDPVDVSDLALDVVRALDFEFRNHGVVTRVELASELPPVLVHKGQLQEVIMNLVHNAIEAMDAVDGLRVLKIRTDFSGGDAVTITVEDTGPGISPEVAENIFDAFVTTKPRGMGLGLAICRMIVERHEGQLSLAAASPRGAIFRILLPKAPSLHWSGPARTSMRGV